MIEDKMYWIGGSPCSGKSTMAEKLVSEFNFDYYKCDDHLERYMGIGAAKNNALMKDLKSKTLDEIWLRPPKVQADEEFEFYRYALNIIEKEVKELYSGKEMVVEGAAILPEFIKGKNILNSRYICIAPTEKFQIEQYSKREWVNHYLKDCSDVKKAFENWMKRDAIYAREVIQQANTYGMNHILVDGSVSVDDQYKMVKEMFELI